MKIYYDNRNNQIYCTDAYEHKDYLKGLGFKWFHIGSSWIIPFAKDLMESCNLIVDIAVDCGIDYYDFCEIVNTIFEVKGDFKVDDAHNQKVQDAYGE